MGVPITTQGLGVVRTPMTHTGGAALDIHITEKSPQYQAKVRPVMKISDRNLSVVQTQMAVVTSSQQHMAQPREHTVAVLWTNCKAGWRKALERAEMVAWHHQRLFSEITSAMCDKQRDTPRKVDVIDLVITLTHAVIVTARHSSSMTRVADSRRKSQDSGSHHRFCL